MTCPSRAVHLSIMKASKQAEHTQKAPDTTHNCYNDINRHIMRIPQASSSAPLSHALNAVIMGTRGQSYPNGFNVLLGTLQHHTEARCP